MTPRVWDAYLTDQDRAHVAELPAHQFSGDGVPALVLVDLYRAVFGDEPEPLLVSTRRWPASCGMAGWQALPTIRGLLAEARNLGIPVVHVTGSEDLPHWRLPAAEAEPVVQKDSGGVVRDQMDRFAIVPQVAPQPGELVLRKAAPSAFWGTPLAAYLNYHRIDTIVVVGESTSGCVRATVVDGVSFRFRMVVVEDGVFDRHEATHAINLFDMHQKYADVIDSRTALNYLRSVGLSSTVVEASEPAEARR